MTKEEFKTKLTEAGFDFEMFVNLLCYNKATLYHWLEGVSKFPVFIEPLLDLLIVLKQKSLSESSETKINTPYKDFEQEIAYYKKAIALKKENDKLKNKFERLKDKKIKDLIKQNYKNRKENNEKPS